jgi:formylglycine-generating enzyme required for sulfatase activity
MKHSARPFALVFILLVLLAACAPSTGGQTSSAPSPAPVASSGPELKTGSKVQYVDGSMLVAVPAGPFTMGGSGADNPKHTVTLGGFWIYTTKVTNRQFASCVQGGGCTAPDPKDNQGYASLGAQANSGFTSPDMKANAGYSDAPSANDPVVGVTYDQAAAYCNYVHARLPTEAEWEKTARGPDGNVYPWGSDNPSCDLLNFNKCVGQTTNVVSYPQGASYYQALDMEGNAFEWVADRYSPTYYATAPTQDPAGPDTGKDRSVRSSSYASTADQTRASTRFFEDPANHRNDLGFRCVVLDPTYFAPFCQMVVVAGPVGPPPPTGSCPTPFMHSEPVCLPGKVPGEVVTFGPEDAGPGSGLGGAFAGCTFDSLSKGKWIKWVCKPPASPPGAILSFSAVCTVSGTDGCVPGYDYDPATKSCRPKAGATTAGKCLPGLTYDPASQCCSAVSGSVGPYAPCPAGYYYWAAKNKCSRVVTASAPLIPGDCSSTGKPPGENPPPPPCNPNSPNGCP